MSVINSMLKRLDARGVAGAALGVGSGAVRPPSPAVVGRWRLPLLVAGAGALIAGAMHADWAAAGSWLGVSASMPRPALIAGTDAGSAAPASASPGVDPASASVGTRDHLTAANDTTERAVAARAPASTRPSPPSTPLPPPEVLSAIAPAVTPPPMPPRIERRNREPAVADRFAAATRRATEAYQSGHFRAALSSAHEALAINRSHVPSRLLAAALENDLGAPDRALALLREGLGIAPHERSLAWMLARLQAASADSAGALATLEAWQLDDASASGLKAGLLAQSERWSEAQLAYESAARQEPSNALWWFGLGISLDAQADRRRAREAYARASSTGLASVEQADYAARRLSALAD